MLPDTKEKPKDQAAACDELPHWVAHKRNGRAGCAWRDLKTGLWHVQCAKGHLTFDSAAEAEQAVAKWPASPPPRQRKARILPLSSDGLTVREAGFVVRDEKGREVGGAIGRPGGWFDGYALGEKIGQFASENAVRIAIDRAAKRIRRERREARERENVEALRQLRGGADMIICCTACGKGPRAQDGGELLFKTTDDGQFWCADHLPRDSKRYQRALEQRLDPDIRDRLRQPSSTDGADEDMPT